VAITISAQPAARLLERIGNGGDVEDTQKPFSRVQVFSGDLNAASGISNLPQHVSPADMAATALFGVAWPLLWAHWRRG